LTFFQKAEEECGKLKAQLESSHKDLEVKRFV